MRNFAGERVTARSGPRLAAVLLLGGAVTLAAMFGSLTSGAFEMTFSDVMKTLFRLTSNHEHDLVIFDFRLPRIVISALVGIGLGTAGAVVQGVTRNGLADPGILGINAGAGAAVVLFMFMSQGQIQGGGWTSVMAMPLFGLAGGLTAAALIYLFAWKGGRLDAQRLILTGIAITSGFGAVTVYMTLKMKSTDFEMAAVWLSGSIWSANWKYIWSMLPWLVILLPVIYRRAYLLDVLQLGEDSAKSLGLKTEKEKAVLLLSSIGIVSACVSVSGGIGFVGLMAPHMARRLVGLQHRRLLPVCGMLGMILVIVSDWIAKTVFMPAEVPVGIVISIVGAPYFIYLLYKARA